MRIGYVIGSVHSTKKYPTLRGNKLLIVQPLNHRLKKTGNAIVCVDSIGAGSNEMVIFVEAREATIPLEERLTPTDATITGIVERVDTEKGLIYKKGSNEPLKL
ncbi:EutN/CcmL family microcompartment protein [candidate division WOR-3 bacterium]|nr:EutN/CcmL family microcompartment protein [candidate division WOR-3 bacterium]